MWGFKSSTSAPPPSTTASSTNATHQTPAFGGSMSTGTLTSRNSTTSASAFNTLNQVAATTSAPSSASTTNSSSDDWSLRKNLELCGAVPPPVYADVHTDVHLNTFDVTESGNAVLVGATGRLYVLNLLHVPKKVPSASSLVAAAHSLAHVTLDPPLPPHEVSQVEHVRVNASHSHVLLVARSWVKVVKLPPNVADALGRSSVVSHAQQLATSQRTQSFLATPVSATHNNSSTAERFSATFTDGSSAVVTLPDAAATDSDVDVLTRVQQAVDAQQQRNGARAHRTVAWISRELGTATVQQVGYFTTVRDALWHPLSDAHVVVLSDAEELSLFYTAGDVSKPEQRHALDFGIRQASRESQSQFTGHGTGASPTTTALAFGAASSRLWDAFTAYILRSDGSVFALCPLVPFDCRVPQATITALRTDVDAHVRQIKQALDDAAAAHALQTATGIATTTKHDQSHLVAQLAALKSQKYWLDESWTLAYPSDTTASTTTMMRCVLPHVSGISPETWPLAVQGSVETTPVSMLENKHNVRGGSVANALLAVAMPSTTTSRVASPLLLRAFTSGHVELLLLDAPIRPQWQQQQRNTKAGGATAAAAGSSSRRLPALLLECLHLEIDDSGGRAALVRDPADARLVYCLHSTGVHVLNVHWVFALASGKQFTSLPKSAVRHIFSVSPSSSSSALSTTNVSNVIGARVVKNVFVGHLLLLRLASGSFEVVNVSVASSELLKSNLQVDDAIRTGISASSSSSNAKPFAQLPGALAPVASAHKTSASSTGVAAAVRPFSDIVEERVETLAARGTRVTGHTLQHEVDDAVLAFVVERTKILLEDVEYMDAMGTLTADRNALHTAMLAAQTERAAAVEQSVKQTTASFTALHAKMQRALAVQENLRKRAAAVLQAVKENQPTLSRAECDFKAELEQLAIHVRRMKPRVVQLTVAGQRVARSLDSSAAASVASSPSASMRSYYAHSAAASSSGLSDDTKRMCYDVLRAETQLIDDTKALIEDMTTSLQRLKT